MCNVPVRWSVWWLNNGRPFLFPGTCSSDHHAYFVYKTIVIHTHITVCTHLLYLYEIEKDTEYNLWESLSRWQINFFSKIFIKIGKLAEQREFTNLPRMMESTACVTDTVLKNSLIHSSQKYSNKYKETVWFQITLSV